MEAKDLPLFDRAREEYGTIETTGAVFKPWLKTVGYVVDEARITFDKQGAHIYMVDSTNVCMLRTTLYASAFENYDVDATVGVDVGKFKHIVRRARVGSDDTLQIDVNDNQILAEVSRGYDDVNIVSADTVPVLDPKSIRENADMPKIELKHKAQLSAEAFTDVVNHITAGDLFAVGSTDGSLSVRNSVGSEVVLDGVDIDCEETYYSGEYVETLRDIVNKGRIDTVHLAWSDDFPIVATCQRVKDGQRIASYQFMLAPRIQND